jgi:hypothetical protein
MKIDIRQSFATLDEPRHKYSSLVTCLLPLNPHEIEYKQVVEDNERLIARIEQAMTDDDLIELLLQTPPKGPVN